MICTVNGKRQQGTFGHQVDRTVQSLFQLNYHSRMFHQAYAGSPVKLHQYVHVALRRLFATGEGAEEPCLQDRLRLEVLGYLLTYLLCCHRWYHIFLTAKIAIISKTAKETETNNSRYDKKTQNQQDFFCS